MADNNLYLVVNEDEETKLVPVIDTSILRDLLADVKRLRTFAVNGAGVLAPDLLEPLLHLCVCQDRLEDDQLGGLFAEGVIDGEAVE
jgi:hypothetical protein